MQLKNHRPSPTASGVTCPASGADIRCRQFRIAWGGTLLALMVVTWPLWTPLRAVPRLPILPALGAFPPATDFVLLGLLAATVLLALRRQTRTVLPVLLLGLLMAVDQLRWQPWAYHALLVGGLLAWCRASRVISLSQWLTISVYGYAAVAKLDITFAETLGPQFLNAAVGLLGIEPQPWSATTALIAPLGEATVACLLGASLRWQSLRRWAVIMALVMHAGNIALLGPWAMGHSWGVLGWNVGFAWQTVVLFWPMSGEGSVNPPPPLLGEGLGEGAESCTEINPPSLGGRGTSWAMSAMFLLALFAPLSSPWGLWDRWPSWGLYAPGGERATVYVHSAVFDRLPSSLRPFTDAAVDSPWQRVRLDRWVFAETGVPLYPQNRVRLALAAALADRYPLGGHVRAVVEFPADRFTGKRDARTLEGADAIQQEAEWLGQRSVAVWTE